jgi:hypothetical protein
MKPSEICRQYGITIKQVSTYTEQSEQTLINWHKNKRWLFLAVVVGTAQLKSSN